MNLRSLAKGLSYSGEVAAKRQTYHVFEGKRYFLVMSQSRSKRNAGNFNVVRADAVEYVASRFARKKKVTSTDVAKALCLGAKAVLIGRAYAYGLGAAGGRGVARAIEILRTDLVRTMKLLGCASVRELDMSYVDVPYEWTRRPAYPETLKYS